MRSGFRSARRPVQYSLRRRLVLALALVVGGLWLLAAAVAFRLAHREADRLFDVHLQQTADTLLAIVAGGDVEDFIEELEEHGEDYELPIAYHVWRQRKGRVIPLVSSPEAPPAELPAVTGFFERDEDGTSWRYFAARDRRGRYVVLVGQAHAERYQVAAELGLHMLLPLVVGLPLMAVAIWWVVGRAMRPVDAVAGEVAALDVHNLSALRVGGPLPKEIAPLMAAIDALIARVSQALDNERRFTADAAHELRTPLAALRVQAQVAGRIADDEARRNALAQVIAAVDRMTHLVEQLLTLARLDPAADAAELQDVDPEPIAATVVAERAPAAARKGQSLELEAARGRIVRSRPAWIEIMLRNLVDNALNYAGEGARVRVRIATGGSGPVLVVEDDGPGIPRARRPAMLERFSRGEAADGVEGCGLGLSIVARIAQLSGARLALEDGLERADGRCGLAVRVEFPAR